MNFWPWSTAGVQDTEIVRCVPSRRVIYSVISVRSDCKWRFEADIAEFQPATPAFVGNTPSEVQMAEGEHTVSVRKTGFKDLGAEGES